MKTTTRGFIVPLLLIIVAILLAGGGAYLYTQTMSENPPVAENVALPQATSTAPTTSLQTSASQTADWKTYTSNKYGFEVKYPESYSVFHTSGDSNIDFRSTESCKALQGGGGEWPADCQAYDMSVQQNKIITEGAGVTNTSVIVDGIHAEKIESPSGIGMWNGMDQIVVQFQKGQNWYIQTFTFNQGKSQIAESVMNQILSTFKFNP